MSQRNELTIDEVVKDPMIRMLMKADRVDPATFEAMLRSLAHAQGKRRAASSFRSPKDPGRGWPLSKVAKTLGEACPSW
jgi:hypothetical protein